MDASLETNGFLEREKVFDKLTRRITALETFLDEEIVKRGRHGVPTKREQEIEDILATLRIYEKNSTDPEQIAKVLENLKDRFGKIVDNQEMV